MASFLLYGFVKSMLYSRGGVGFTTALLWRGYEWLMVNCQLLIMVISAESDIFRFLEGWDLEKGCRGL